MRRAPVRTIVVAHQRAVKRMETSVCRCASLENGDYVGMVWSSEEYRGVIFFILGAERARAMWCLCSPFNVGLVEYAAGMIREAPVIEFWEKLEAVS